MKASASPWQCVAQWRGHQGAVYDLACDAAGHIWSVGGDGLLVQWNRALPDWDATGEAMARTDQALFSVAAVDDGMVAGGASGGMVHRTEQGTEVLTGHEGGTFLFQGALSAGADGRLRNWRTGEIVAEVPGRIRCVLREGDAHSAKLGTHLGRIHDVKTGWVVHAHEGSVRVLLPWPGKPAVATAGVDGRLKLWSTAKEPWTELLSIEAHKGAIYRAVASPDGRWVATASRDKSVAVWDATTLELAARLQGPGMKGHTRSVNALLWTDADTLISGGDDRRILVWRHTSDPGPETHDARH